MSAERPGCLKFLGPVANLFAIKDRPVENLGKRMVKTESGIEVELLDDQPDEFAEVMARTFKTGVATAGHFDEKTGKFIIEEIDIKRPPKEKGHK